jgi:hypothetical protein
MTWTTVIAIAGVLVACSQDAPPASEVDQAATTSVVNAEARSDSLPLLIEQLRSIEGVFRISAGGVWEFSGDRQLFEQIRLFRDAAVEQLVRCLERSEETRTLAQESFVPLGVLCYEVLTDIAYHEAVDSTGGIDGEWPGYILPTASLIEIRAARRAWADVVQNRSYILYP